MIESISQERRIGHHLVQIFRRNNSTAELAEDQQAISLLASSLNKNQRLFEHFIAFLQDKCRLKPSVIFQIINKIVADPKLCKLLGDNIFKLWLQFKMFEALDILKTTCKQKRKKVNTVFQMFKFKGSNLRLLIEQCCAASSQSMFDGVVNDIQSMILEPNEIKERIPILFKSQISQISFSIINSNELNIKIVGNSGVGKTSILFNYTEGSYNSNNRSSVKLDKKHKIIKIQEEQIRLTIWDTVGQDKYKTVSNLYYRGSNGIIIVYDITNQTSFVDVIFWLKQIQECVKKQVTILILGNKLDLQKQRKVSFEKLNQFATQRKYPCLQVSALTSENISTAFQMLVKEIQRKQIKPQRTNKKDSLIIQDRQSKIKQRKTCC